MGLVGFCRVESGCDWIRGRKSSLEQIISMKERPVSIGSNLKRAVVSARPVVPSRVSLPEKVGCCEPEAFLCEERRAVLRALSKIVLDEEHWATPLPRPCHMIDTPILSLGRSAMTFILISVCLVWLHRGTLA